jgi:AcrR family transcriptional regulator
MSDPTQQQSTEAVILEAAKRVFLRKGYAGSRMQEVADEAHINKAMLHYYFRSKERLFGRILSEAMNRLHPLVQQALSAPGLSIEEKLGLVVDHHIDLIMEEPHLPLFIIHELSQRREQFIEDFAARADRKVMLGFVQQVFAEQEAGKIAAVNPIHLILNTMSLTVFPFIAGPLLQATSGLPEKAYRQVLSERKTEVKRVIAALLQP